jgi:hypothetical protein
MGIDDWGDLRSTVPIILMLDLIEDWRFCFGGKTEEDEDGSGDVDGNRTHSNELKRAVFAMGVRLSLKHDGRKKGQIFGSAGNYPFS